MSSLRPVGGPVATPEKDRVSVCSFTFSDSRRCRTPRSPNHPHLCAHHARKESQARVTEHLADELAYLFSGQYLSANDLSAALGRLLPAIVRGDIQPRTARSMAYLVQTIQLAQHEYINASAPPSGATPSSTPSLKTPPTSMITPPLPPTLHSHHPTQNLSSRATRGICFSLS